MHATTLDDVRQRYLNLHEFVTAARAKLLVALLDVVASLILLSGRRQRPS